MRSTSTLSRGLQILASIEDAAKNADIITANSDLVVGSWYLCLDKRIGGQVSLLECKEEEGKKYLGQRIWADADNSQALERWIVVGPIFNSKTARGESCQLNT